MIYEISPHNFTPFHFVLLSFYFFKKGKGKGGGGWGGRHEEASARFVSNNVLRNETFFHI